MTKINVLDRSIFSKIAAGEVVEKPSSVIKETVENSIDAGATHITVEIEQGGIKKIRVSDDGSGIYFDDLKNAFMPHATSKISSIDDLSKIGTLGFRGEALSSISSVSHTTLVSKTKDSEIGGEIVINGGQIESIKEKGCPNGTYITVEDLFYCVPARKKFLRKPKLEEADCTNIVTRLILANPNISFKYIVDNKIIFNTQGTGLKDAIFVIYGKEFVDNLIEVDHYNEILDIHVHGYITRPTFTKANRTYQSLFINKRYVINQVVSTAIYKAYEPFLMKGGFPVFILNLDFPLDKVDVNVHPNKLDVKFEDSNKIFGLVNGVVSEILYNLNHTKTISTYSSEIEEKKDTIDTSKLEVLDKNEGHNYQPNNDEIKPKMPNIQDLHNTMQNTMQNENYSHFANIVNSFKSSTDTIGEIHSETEKNKIAEKVLSNYTSFEKPEQVELPKQQVVQDSIRELALEYKVIGVAFATYIILQQDKNLLFIDQHAAHERLLYDKFKAELDNSKILSTDLLVPYVLNLNSQEFAFIMDNIDTFKALGFDIYEFGNNCIKVSSLPVLFKDIDFVSFFNKILSDMTTLSIKKTDMLEDYLARSACRAAVKANDILTDIEIKSILSMLNNDHQVLLCPHGRPVVVKISDKEIEKWFKRIV